MSNAENSAQKQRGRPFAKGTSGNPASKPKGARHAATLAAEAMLDGESEALTRKAVALALEGDTVALRLCLERVIAPRRDRAVSFSLPPLVTVADAPKALAALVEGVASGALTAPEAADLAGLVEKFVRSVELSDHEARIAALETKDIPK